MWSSNIYALESSSMANSLVRTQLLRCVSEKLVAWLIVKFTNRIT